MYHWAMYDRNPHGGYWLALPPRGSAGPYVPLAKKSRFLAFARNDNSFDGFSFLSALKALAGIRAL